VFLDISMPIEEFASNAERASVVSGHHIRHIVAAVTEPMVTHRMDLE